MYAHAYAYLVSRGVISVGGSWGNEGKKGGVNRTEGKKKGTE
jgi:hypothetical protein